MPRWWPWNLLTSTIQILLQKLSLWHLYMLQKKERKEKRGIAQLAWLFKVHLNRSFCRVMILSMFCEHRSLLTGLGWPVAYMHVLVVQYMSEWLEGNKRMQVGGVQGHRLSLAVAVICMEPKEVLLIPATPWIWSTKTTFLVSFFLSLWVPYLHHLVLDLVHLCSSRCCLRHFLSKFYWKYVLTLLMRINGYTVLEWCRWVVLNFTIPQFSCGPSLFKCTSHQKYSNSHWLVEVLLDSLFAYWLNEDLFFHVQYILHDCNAPILNLNRTKNTLKTHSVLRYVKIILKIHSIGTSNNKILRILLSWCCLFTSISSWDSVHY